MNLNHLVYYIFAISTFLILIAIISAYIFLGKVVAIKGSYVLIGFLLATALYRGGSETDRDFQTTDHLGRWSIKIVIILTISAYLVTYVTGARLEATVVTLVLGYSLLAYQILFTKVTIALVPQIGILFTVSPVTKYISTGFYFGETDLFGHVRAVELLYQTGQIESINIAYPTYEAFPALHILSGAISSFTGLPAYDSLMVVGIVTYTVAMITVFYLCRSLFPLSKSITITLVFSILSVIHNYTTYFFPQALATALIIFLFYVTIRRHSVPNAEYLSLSLSTILIIICIVFTHHVTQLIFVGLVGSLYAPSIFRVTKFGQQVDINKSLPRFIPILFALTAGITYLFVISPNTVDYFFRFGSNMVDNPFVSDTGGGRTVFGLGTEIPYHTPRVAIKSLFYIDGLFYIGLTTLFVVGVVATVVSYDQYMRVAGILLVGIGGSLAVLQTPLPETVSRLSLPLAFFFSVIAGIGLWQLTRNDGNSSRTIVEEGPNKRQVGVFVLIVLVGTTGPLVAADDLYGLHAGPNLWETYSTPEQQVEFSDQELHEFEAMVHYVDQHTSEITMLWVSREASSRFSDEERLAPTNISEEGIQAESPLVYRTNWTNHQVGYSTDELGTLSIADWWLDREIGASNKVYTTGKVGVVGTETGTHLSADRETDEEEDSKAAGDIHSDDNGTDAALTSSPTHHGS